MDWIPTIIGTLCSVAAVIISLVVFEHQRKVEAKKDKEERSRDLKKDTEWKVRLSTQFDTISTSLVELKALYNASAIKITEIEKVLIAHGERIKSLEHIIYNGGKEE